MSTLKVHGKSEAVAQRDGDPGVCTKCSAVSDVCCVSSMNLPLHQEFREVDFFHWNCWNLLMQSVENLFLKFRFAVWSQQPAGLPRTQH